jgi:AAT family amino acid transporter
LRRTEFTRLTGNGLPLLGTSASAALMTAGVWINYQWPSKAFDHVVSFATISGMWAWIVILAAHIRYRRAADRGRLPESAFKAPCAPYASWGSLGFIGAVVVLMGFDTDSRVSLYGAPVWAAGLVVAYFVVKARDPGTFQRGESASQRKDGS